MARKQKLKVFRTPTGFHDAYVAAPSQKAALEAWGSDADLFARGIAEVVTDEELSREPLENPGKVIRRSRGTAAEQLAALPEDTPGRTRQRAGAGHENAVSVVRRKRIASRTSSSRRSGTAKRTEDPPERSRQQAPKAKPKPKPAPRPSRARLDAAESGLAAILERQEREAAEMRERERALEKERRTMDAAHERERRAAERAVDREREDHSERLDRWIERNG